LLAHRLFFQTVFTPGTPDPFFQISPLLGFTSALSIGGLFGQGGDPEFFSLFFWANILPQTQFRFLAVVLAVGVPYCSLLNTYYGRVLQWTFPFQPPTFALVSKLFRAGPFSGSYLVEKSVSVPGLDVGVFSAPGQGGYADPLSRWPFH